MEGLSVLDDAFFVSSRVHERPVTLPDGSTHALHFRELPAVEFIKFSSQRHGGSEDAQAAAAVRLVAASLCDADGKPAMTLERALTLKTDALNALFEAVMSVNGQQPPADGEDDPGNA